MILLIKSSKDNPAAFAAIGNKLVSVIPGNVFISNNQHLSLLSNLKSTLEYTLQFNNRWIFKAISLISSDFDSDISAGHI